MKILAVDFSNSSMKFSLYAENNELLVNGLFERIGFEGSKYTLFFNNQNISEEIDISNQDVAVEILLIKLQDLEFISSVDEIRAVGHKIIHGGNKYGDSVLINEFVISELEKLIDYAPLHTSASLKGIRAFEKALPTASMIGVFDTGFYKDIDEVNYLYPVPYKWYSDYGIRKYGFNGINHRSAVDAIKKEINNKNFKMISCYIDKVVSISAIDNMKCIDTSMGFTPLSGAMMATRSGDIDSSIIPFVMEKEGKSASEIVEDLNKNSGLLGLSEYSNSIIDIIEKAADGDKKCLIAKNKYIRRIVDYIAKYYVLLGGVDIISFTGNIGVNSAMLRKEIIEELEVLGVKLDLDLNSKNDGFMNISLETSNIDVYVVPTDEFLSIADETFKFIR
ncbi:MAG: acetate/propionate family kinase [Bacilli bacterium]|nr:acetate/propionate family kinase [Bacilli bacterium]